MLEVDTSSAKKSLFYVLLKRVGVQLEIWEFSWLMYV